MMRIEFEPQDIELIAQRVVDLLKPAITTKKEKVDAMVFDVKSLAEYLKVSPHWIYERTHLKQIPHIKVRGFLRFSKKDIDKWLDAFAIKSRP
jgi:excisionase family DNA binding protein